VGSGFAGNAVVQQEQVLGPVDLRHGGYHQRRLGVQPSPTSPMRPSKALFPRDANTAQDLVHKAEQAMHAAKTAGPAQQRFFDEAMNQAASARVALEHDLRRAIATGELCLHFQPKVHARTGVMTGAEALVRWRHPVRGLVQPDEFIPLAEQCGLILALGDWVLQAGCEALQRWARTGAATVPLSINLASPSLMQTDLVEQVDTMIRRFGIQPRQLTFEIAWVASSAWRSSPKAWRPPRRPRPCWSSAARSSRATTFRGRCPPTRLKPCWRGAQGCP
jgi:hypothetical protein